MFTNLVKILVLLSTVSAHTESSDEAVVHMKPKVVTASSNSNLLRGASASVWNRHEDRESSCGTQCADHWEDEGGGSSFPYFIQYAAVTDDWFYCCTECMSGNEAKQSSSCNRVL